MVLPDESFPRLDDLQARGIWVNGDQLAPPRRARSVRVRAGKAIVTDGPSNVSYWFGFLLNELPFVAFYWLLASTTLAIAVAAGRGRRRGPPVRGGRPASDRHPGLPREGTQDLVLWIESRRAVVAGDALVDFGRGFEIRGSR